MVWQQGTNLEEPGELPAHFGLNVPQLLQLFWVEDGLERE
jgi:hypothetical protein